MTLNAQEKRGKHIYSIMERASERESERLVPSSVLSMVYPKNNNEREIDNFCVLYTVPVFLDRYMKCLIYLA